MSIDLSLGFKEKPKDLDRVLSSQGFVLELVAAPDEIHLWEKYQF